MLAQPPALVPPLPDWLLSVIWLAGAALVGLTVQQIVFRTLAAALRRDAQQRDTQAPDAPDADAPDAAHARGPGSRLRPETFLDSIRLPAALLVPLLVMLWALAPADLPPRADAFVRHALAILSIAVATWLVTRGFAGLAAAFLAGYDVDQRDNLHARRVHTRLRVLTRVGTTVIWVLGVAAILMTFPGVRQLGTTILASAGIAGIVVGLAAQRTLGNFLAGIQIALSQPIRLDDAVVIDGEWGWIEEITLTYVVVRIWDDRRLIVPFTSLLEQPFQNWTRTTAHLLGQVSLWVDYRVPVRAVREELERIVADCPHWDGRAAVLQVVDTTDRAIHLRALVSGADSPTTWSLRCHVREALIEFLQREHPESLPVTRALVDRLDTPGGASDHRPAGDTDDD